MKTTKITRTLSIVSLILFLAISALANLNKIYSGGQMTSFDKKEVVNLKATTDETTPATSDSKLNYLRFDVNKYMNENEGTEILNNEMNYLRFDASKFMNTDDLNDMPASTEFSYLRFDVNKFANDSNLTELPQKDFSYLRFDVSSFTQMNSGDSIE